MKKLMGIVAVIVVILGGIIGYKVVYKLSPRDFITKDTRIIYANEGINSKDFTPILTLVDDVETKEKISSQLKNFKYISKIYMFSDKEFYEVDEKSFTVVIDTGYWYFLTLKDIDKYFDLTKDTYILKKEVKDKYFPDLNGDIFMKNYRGLYFISLGEKNLKNFIEKDKDYLYNKEIEESIDTKLENLFGTLIYNNSGTDYYGINLITNSATMEGDKIVSEGEIFIDEEENEIFKSTKENKELIKYIDENDIYISVDDFSKLDKIIFNPLFIGANIDSQAMFAIWKNFLGIDIEEILKEIDGEVILNLDTFSFMIKIKENSPEISRILMLAKNENSPFYIDKKIEVKDNIVLIGDIDFEENPRPYQVNREVFLFGEITSAKLSEFGEMNISLKGENGKITIKNRVSSEIVKEILKEY